MSTTMESLEIRLNQLVERMTSLAESMHVIEDRLDDIDGRPRAAVACPPGSILPNSATPTRQCIDLCAILGDIESVASDAIATFGETSQYNKAIEECAELIDAICKTRADRGGVAHTAQEAADVFIMAVQVGEMAGMDLFIAALRRKTERLRGLIGGTK